VNRNLIIGFVVSGLVVVGGVGYFLTQKDSGSSTNSLSVSKPEATNQEADSTAFNPQNTLQSDFVATVETTGDDTAGAFAIEIEFDADAKVWRYITTSEDGGMEMIVTEDATYTKTDDQWIKLPTSGDSTTGFDRDTYELSDDEIADFQKSAGYKGEASCPAGTCDLWELEGYEGNDKLAFYVDKKTNTVNQLVTTTGATTNTITYTYKDVTIEIPANAQELPSFN